MIRSMGTFDMQNLPSPATHALGFPSESRKGVISSGGAKGITNGEEHGSAPMAVQFVELDFVRRRERFVNLAAASQDAGIPIQQENRPKCKIL